MTRAAMILTVLCGCATVHPAPLSPWEQTEHALPDEPAPAADGDDSAPARGRVLRGRASYYHDSLAGNSTASGEPYDPRKRTAASRTLPFGTRLRVTRVDNGRSTLVRVNDRGPFGRRARILDLSRRAAEDLDMIRAGVVTIRAEVLPR